MKTQLVILLGIILLLVANPAAAGLKVAMKMIAASGMEQAAGTIEISESAHGLVFSPDLRGLTPGLHGFHLHQNPSCAPGMKNGKVVAGLGAGGHFDPAGTKKHDYPWGDGHLGDLPALFVDRQGEARSPVLAPRLKIDDVRKRALMIHAGGDNYSDQPKKLGGGGARMACGVID
jgi:Cu-Zn family superoxide dismutase